MVFWDQIVIRIFSVLTLIANALVVLYILDFIYGKIFNERILGKLWKHFRGYVVHYVFLVSFTATFGSLIFSEVLHFTPCLLCWYQRILMYPQVLLSGLAIIRKDKRILSYLLLLSIFGALIAGYHYYGQLNENTPLPCSTLGYSASCSDRFFLQFGYITIPFMAFSAFLLIIAAWFLYERDRV